MASEFTQRDIAFVIEAANPDLLNRRDLVQDDETFVDHMLENHAPEMVRRLLLMNQDTIVSSISPRLLFEVLLRAARKELANRTYTLERSSLQRIPVFDTGDVLRFIRDDEIIKYLARMLTSFTRVRSFTWPVRIRKGVWRRIRFNDMDIDSLMRYSETVESEERFDYYKRIGDLCLFIVGMFPEYAGLSTGGASQTQARLIFGRRQRLAEEYEAEGSRFYRLAAQHKKALLSGSSRVLERMAENFSLAKKPLNYVSERYLDFRKGMLFAPGTSQ